jgi:hypothetical protein
MRKLILVLLTTVVATLARAQQTPLPPVAPPPPGQPERPVSLRVRTIEHQSENLPARTAPSPANYRLRVELKDGTNAPMEICVVTSVGRVKTQMVNPKRTVIDEREVLSTIDLTANLSPLEGNKCQLTLFLGRTVPYETGRVTGPGGKSTPQYQQMQLGLDTTVVLQVGQPLIVQSDPTQQIKVTLERPAD